MYGSDFTMDFRKVNLTEAAVVLLAGGRSSRMGQPKGLLNFRGRPWIIEQIHRLQDAGLTQIIVVLGHSADTYLSFLAYQEEGESRNSPRLVTAINPNPEMGTFSSIQVGVQLAQTAFPNQSHRSEGNPGLQAGVGPRWTEGRGANPVPTDRHPDLQVRVDLFTWK